MEKGNIKAPLPGWNRMRKKGEKEEEEGTLADIESRLIKP